MNPSPTPQIVIYASKEKGLGPVGNRPDEGPQMPVAKYPFGWGPKASPIPR